MTISERTNGARANGAKANGAKVKARVAVKAASGAKVRDARVAAKAAGTKVLGVKSKAPPVAKGTKVAPAPKPPAKAPAPKTPPVKLREADEGEPLGVALDFMRLLWAVDHGLQLRSKRMEAELGVTGMQRVVIRLIGRYPGIAAGRLAELLHVHPSTLTGVLRRLVERGYARRERDPEDARKARFELLESGFAIDATQAGTIEAAIRRALSRLAAPNVDAARGVLAIVAEELARSDR